MAQTLMLLKSTVDMPMIKALTISKKLKMLGNYFVAFRLQKSIVNLYLAHPQPWRSLKNFFFEEDMGSQSKEELMFGDGHVKRICYLELKIIGHCFFSF